jgi:NhaA family Na+:H+ antiporter
MAAEPVRAAREASSARALPAVVGRFVRTEAAGGVVLVVAATVALVWANSPWQDAYAALWDNEVTVAIGSFTFSEDLRHVVNDGLMALFFFVVGLEIKREIVLGELADRRIAALPVCAAIGGMVLPAGLYLLVASGGETGHGWGIPMATDIAFALGVLALLGSRISTSLKLFLLTLAVVDDLGAIAVIAVFYSDTIDTFALALAAAGVVISVLLRRVEIDWPPIYVVVAILTWYATYRSGVHPTIAGVALALTTPTHRIAPADMVRRWAQGLSDEPTAAEVHQMKILARETVSPAEHLEELLHPATSFVVLPLFALANAGVELRAGMLDAPGATKVAAGIAVGLIAGKLLGIVAGARISTRTNLAVLPTGLSWRHLSGAGALGGIGFTVSLFIAGLAFTDPALVDAAKVAILGASLTSAAIGAGMLLRRDPPEMVDADTADAAPHGTNP